MGHICNVKCQICDYFNANICITCNTGRAAPNCDVCADGFYLDTTDGLCKACDVTCKKCVNGTASGCTECGLNTNSTPPICTPNCSCAC